MARVFVTGSADGLGLMAARSLLENGHEVVLHARNPSRAEDTRKRLPAAKAVVVGDLASLAQTRAVAEQANRLGPFDAVIHNAGVGYQEPRIQSEDGLPRVFAVNVLSFYVLTALVHRPKRLVYLSSGMHRGADASLDDLEWTKRRWRGAAAYAESKLCDERRSRGARLREVLPPPPAAGARSGDGRRRPTGEAARPVPAVLRGRARRRVLTDAVLPVVESPRTTHGVGS